MKYRQSDPESYAHDSTGPQLYRIPKNRGEENDLATRHPDVVKSLSAKAPGWEKSLPASRLCHVAGKTGHTQDDHETPGPAKAKEAADGTHSNQKNEIHTHTSSSPFAGAAARR
jgi:hypothetical protein